MSNQTDLLKEMLQQHAASVDSSLAEIKENGRATRKKVEEINTTLVDSGITHPNTRENMIYLNNLVSSRKNLKKTFKTTLLGTIIGAVIMWITDMKGH